MPNEVISIVMQDGRVQEIMPEWAFDQIGAGDEPVSGGGGAVVVGNGQKEPLVVQTTGNRNPDGKVVTESIFSQVLNLDDVKAVLIGETEYPL